MKWFEFDSQQSIDIDNRVQKRHFPPHPFQNKNYP